jgi:integrase
MPRRDRAISGKRLAPCGRPGRRREHRGLYSLRHTFTSFAIAADVDTFTLARVMGTSVQLIDATYGHLLKGADSALFDKLSNFDGCYVAAEREEAETA